MENINNETFRKFETAKIVGQEVLGGKPPGSPTQLSTTESVISGWWATDTESDSRTITDERLIAILL